MIFFTADNHVGINAQWGMKERREDFLKAFENLVDRVLDTATLDKAALLIGGDLFDAVTPPAYAVEFVQGQVRKLAKANVQVYGIDGNHDIADGRWLNVCDIKQLGDEPIDVLGAKVCGLSYARADSILASVRSMAERGVKCDVLVLHLALGELNRMGAASDVTAEEMMPYLKDMGVKLVLIGHIHISQSKMVNGIMFAYCGSSEVCSSTEPKNKSILSFNASEWLLKEVPISTRKIEERIIKSEADLAAFEASEKVPGVLYSIQVSSDIQDGVKRMREVAKAAKTAKDAKGSNGSTGSSGSSGSSGAGALMRIQVLPPAEKEEPSIDRNTGVIGLEGAIEQSFSQDSVEADLVRTILRSPATMKQTVENYLKGEHYDTKQA